MQHITHTLTQGTPEWVRHRDAHFNASDAAAMLGLSSYKTRTELLREKSSGIVEEVDTATQRRFDAGHENEELARPWAEEIMGEELYPIVISANIGGLPLSASLDGANIEGTQNFEHKTLNQALAAALDAGIIPEEYKPQMEQGLLISGAEKCLFMASNGMRETIRYAWYVSDPAVRARLLSGWKQFDADLETYQPAEVIPAAVAAPVIALPAVSIRVDGAVALISNLPVFGEALKAFIARIPQEPSTDQEFADCKEACKRLQDAQDALDAAEKNALAQVATFDEMRRTKALYWDLARNTRLAVEKLVTAREQTVKTGIVQGGKVALAAHVANLNKRLGKPYMPLIESDFVGVAKGKRTIASLQNAVDTELARAKIEANAVADRIEINLNALREAKDHAFLFADAGQIVLKANDDFAVLVKTRIADHKAAEEKRLEAEREKIRAEEAAKLKAEQDRLALEARQREETEAQAERERLLKIEQDRLDAELREAERNTAAPQVPAQPQSVAPSQAQHPEPAAAVAMKTAAPDVGASLGDQAPTATLDAAAPTPSSEATTDEMLRIVRDRIGKIKPYTKIAKAIDDYFSQGQKKAA